MKCDRHIWTIGLSGHVRGALIRWLDIHPENDRATVINALKEGRFSVPGIGKKSLKELCDYLEVEMPVDKTSLVQTRQTAIRARRKKAREEIQ